MQDIYIELPFPPTVNSYYAKTQRGIYISKRGRTFRDAVASACVEQNAYGLLTDRRLEVDVILYPPDARTRDLDNYMKALLDALTQAKVWVDDEQIDDLHPRRGIKVAHGACWVRIREFEGMILPHQPTIWEFI